MQPVSSPASSSSSSSSSSSQRVATPRHLLVTNDFPPKVGGIQSYLWELWRRLDPQSFAVMTTPHEDAKQWDRTQPFRIIRTREKWLLPTRSLAKRIDQLASEFDAQIIVLDPAFPLGVLGPKLHRPYVYVIHGAEYSIPAHLPVVGRLITRMSSRASGILAGGKFVADTARGVLAKSQHNIPVLSIPPGVDTKRFVPLDDTARQAARATFGLGQDSAVVVGVSRLVPRKGFDRLIRAAALLQTDFPQLEVVIGGKGREHDRLARLIEELRAPVRLLGRVSDQDLSALYGCADIFCMPCHDRWGGREVEGFGIVFVEAAAAGLPSVAGKSGGSCEAVQDGKTGVVVSDNVHPQEVAKALRLLLQSPSRRAQQSQAARRMAVEEFEYDLLADRLKAFLTSLSAPPAG